MGTELVAHRKFASQVAAGADQVVAGLWVPANSTVKSVQGFCVFESAVERTLNQIAYGSLAGYLLPIPDPDSSGLMQTVWDTQVPKDDTADVLDLDRGTSDTNPFWEPGAATVWTEVYDVGNSPAKLYQQHFMSMMGMNAIAVNRDPETAFDYEYIGGKTLSVNMRGPLRVQQPSLLVFAIGSPLLTSTSASTPIAAIGEEQWAQLQFIDEVMERAMLDLLGLTEAGAETPFEEATALLRRHMDPQMLEAAGGIYVPTTWNTGGEFEFVVEVQGSYPRGKRIDLGA